MELTFASKYLSIKKFDPTDLPDFTVLTGLNGSGKTHLLKAIEGGNISLKEIGLDDMLYQDIASFRLQKQEELVAEQISEQTNKAWLFLTKEQKFQSGIWTEISQQVFHEVFGNTNYQTDPSSLSFWGSEDDPDEEMAKLKVKYENLIEEKIFQDRAFRGKNQGHAAIEEAIRNCGRPLHSVTREEFENHYLPFGQGENLFSASLGILFTQYRSRQYLWVHDQFEKGNGRDKDKLNQEFSEMHPAPWSAINIALDSFSHHAGDQKVFNFEITNPSADILERATYLTYSFQPKLIDKNDLIPRDFTALSSGEQTLLALAISIFQTFQTRALLPKLLLLDEIDSSLHPSMIKAMLQMLQDVFVHQGISVLLATHSPSTVALAPEGSVHVLEKSQDGSTRILAQSNGEAVQVLSEGFITLDDSFSMLTFVPAGKLGILTEGHNAMILKRLLELHNISDAVVIEGAESKTSKSQIKTLFDFFTAIGHKVKLLFVWDCDCADEYGNVSETENLFRYVIPKNDANTLTPSGIENAFPEEAFEGFTRSVNCNDGAEPVQRFSSNKKKQFSEHIASSDNINWFFNFDELVEKIKEIVA